MRISDQEIDHVYIDKFQRDASFIMPSHHLHPYYELYYVSKGTSRFFINNDIFDIHPGDIMLIPPHTIHYTRYTDSPCVRYAIFYRRQDLDLANVLDLLDFDRHFSTLQIYQTPEFYRENMDRLLDNLILEDKQQDEMSHTMLSLGLAHLLLYCKKVCVSLSDIPQQIHTTDSAVIAAAKYIAEHYREPISAASIASEAGFTPNYFSTKFREATGIGVHEYLTYTRLSHAARELENTDVPITQIALDCGFSTGNYFKDAFRRMYGVTPSAYRKGLPEDRVIEPRGVPLPLIS